MIPRNVKRVSEKILVRRQPERLACRHPFNARQRWKSGHGARSQKWRMAGGAIVKVHNSLALRLWVNPN